MKEFEYSKRVSLFQNSPAKKRRPTACSYRKGYNKLIRACLKNSRWSTVKFHLYVEHIELDVSQAIPVGLILNEAITNALKYAFTTDTSNEIPISMYSKPDGKIELAIADNGKGMPANFRHSRSNSLGIKLMRGLKGDIGGEFSITGTEGTLITVIFINDPVIQQVKKIVAAGAAS